MSSVTRCRRAKEEDERNEGLRLAGAPERLVALAVDRIDRRRPLAGHQVAQRLIARFVRARESRADHAVDDLRPDPALAPIADAGRQVEELEVLRQPQ